MSLSTEDQQWVVKKKITEFCATSSRYGSSFSYLAFFDFIFLKTNNKQTYKQTKKIFPNQPKSPKLTYKFGDLVQLDRHTWTKMTNWKIQGVLGFQWLKKRRLRMDVIKPALKKQKSCSTCPQWGKQEFNLDNSRGGKEREIEIVDTEHLKKIYRTLGTNHTKCVSPEKDKLICRGPCKHSCAIISVVQFSLLTM